MKNSPFSAEAVSESVQTLSDGNRIVRNSTSKLYRNSEGSFRREMKGGTGGVLGSLYTFSEGVTIMDQVGGYRYTIDPNLKTTTRQTMIAPGAPLRVISGLDEKAKSELRAVAAASGGTSVDGAQLSEHLKGEIRTVVAAAPAVAARAAVTAYAAADSLHAVSGAFSMGTNSKWESRTDQLGMQNIEGVEAEGTRTITTIPSGAIGNERPIEITYEKWYSRELQLVVKSKRSDPRVGEQSYRLTNIVRSEPDPSLFSPPSGYRVLTEPSGRSAVSAPGRAAAGERATRAAQASAPKAQP
ncbi:MAG: hypothetical protein H0U23_04430 [Blastocatellia bacterium]|nr:hypothetical protein [Blastocatellia bacterium]